MKTSAVALIIFTGVMFFTNPQSKDYENYASAKIADQVQNSLCNKQDVPDVKILKDLNNIANDACKSNTTKGFLSENFLVKKLIGSNTERQNFGLVSLYTTKTPDKTFRTIGAFGNFLTFPS
ncbi:MAG: DUF4359 domain-containing protein [Mastigocoleus sp.]